jgi:hypothetical protein
MPETEKTKLVVGSTVKFILQSNGWRVEIAHKDGGISGVMRAWPTLEEASAWVKERYDVS